MKKCCRCNIEKSISDFPISSGRSMAFCRDCKREYDRKYYYSKIDKDKKNTTMKKIRNRNRNFIWDYLLKNPCIDCSETNPIVLEFDHHSNKLFSVSDGITLGYSIKRISEEIAKCDVRCANCHRIKTAKDFGWFCK